MKKYLKLIIISFLILFFAAAGYWIYTSFIVYKISDISNNDIYTCPMHPQIVQNKPGQCPICGMDLVKKNELINEKVSDHSISSAELNTVKLSPSQIVLANVQTYMVKPMTFNAEKSFNGYVKMNEAKSFRITSLVTGKIVKMYVNYEGQYLNKGQKIFEIYSPELVSTQKEFLLALDNFEKVKQSGNQLAIEHALSLVNASKERLLLWDMSNKQINELEISRKIKTTTQIFSQYSGVVIKKYMQEGQWVMSGDIIYEIADLSTIWVFANVYETDINYIKVGQIAEITASAYPNEIIKAKINFINPVFNSESRTLEVRIDVNNNDFKLKPDMFVKVKINTFISQALGVPKSAVINNGVRNFVYLEIENGVFTPVEVKIAYEQNGFYAVTSGLKEGDLVVSSGGFLIDSETQIQKGFSSGHENHLIPNTNEDGIKVNPNQNIFKDFKENNIDKEKHNH
jgi:Cu(I)/Ag(I) efflux system membrane fusion protein